jgi:hypothetical protein
MADEQTRESIQIIREMIEKSRRKTAESGFELILWAVMPILAIIGMYVLIAMRKYSLIWINWMFFIGIGILVTIAHARKCERKSGIKTYAQNSAAHVWTACGVAFLLLGFLFPMTGLYSTYAIPVFMAVLAGVGVFATAGIVEWNLLKACGIVWWAGAVVMLFVHEYYRSLVFIPLILAGYLLPGMILQRQVKKQGANHG